MFETNVLMSVLPYLVGLLAGYGLAGCGLFERRSLPKKTVVRGFRARGVMNQRACPCKTCKAGLKNYREAWVALRMIRDAIETLGPVGVLPAGESLEPTCLAEAEVLVAGIKKICDATPGKRR